MKISFFLFLIVSLIASLNLHAREAHRLKIDCNHSKLSNEHTTAEINVNYVRAPATNAHSRSSVHMGSFTPSKSDCKNGKYYIHLRPMKEVRERFRRKYRRLDPDRVFPGGGIGIQLVMSGRTKKQNEDAFFLDTIQYQVIDKHRIISENILGDELIQNDRVDHIKVKSSHKWGANGNRGYCFSHDPTDNQRSWKGYAKSCKKARYFDFDDAYYQNFE